MINITQILFNNLWDEYGLTKKDGRGFFNFKVISTYIKEIGVNCSLEQFYKYISKENEKFVEFVKETYDGDEVNIRRMVSEKLIERIYSPIIFEEFLKVNISDCKFLYADSTDEEDRVYNIDGYYCKSDLSHFVALQAKSTIPSPKIEIENKNQVKYLGKPCEYLEVYITHSVGAGRIRYIDENGIETKIPFKSLTGDKEFLKKFRKLLESLYEKDKRRYKNNENCLNILNYYFSYF